MNSGFINRLVGTSIVVVAAIIFIPNILDGEKIHYKEGFKAIPERPEFTTVDLKPKIDLQSENGPVIRGERVEDERADDHLVEKEIVPIEHQKSPPEVEAIQPKTEVHEAEQVKTELNPVVLEDVSSQAQQVNIPKRAPTSNLTDMAYVIQLGSFSHKPNVDALVQKLKRNGFKAFTRPIKTPNGTLTKVFVGPELDKKKLESKMMKLKELTKLNGRLTQFNIAK